MDALTLQKFYLDVQKEFLERTGTLFPNGEIYLECQEEMRELVDMCNKMLLCMRAMVGAYSEYSWDGIESVRFRLGTEEVMFRLGTESLGKLGDWAREYSYVGYCPVEDTSVVLAKIDNVVHRCGEWEDYVQWFYWFADALLDSADAIKGKIDVNEYRDVVSDSRDLLMGFPMYIWRCVPERLDGYTLNPDSKSDVVYVKCKDEGIQHNHEWLVNRLGLNVRGSYFIKNMLDMPVRYLCMGSDVGFNKHDGLLIYEREKSRFGILYGNRYYWTDVECLDDCLDMVWKINCTNLKIAEELREVARLEGTPYVAVVVR